MTNRLKALGKSFMGISSPILIACLLFHSPSSFALEHASPSKPKQSAMPPKGTVSSPSKKSTSSTQSHGSRTSLSKSKNKNKASKAAKRTNPKKGMVRGQRDIEPSRVIEIQTALATAGYYKDQPSGKWDQSTTQAMSAYQEANGFKVTGKPDALSLKKLGL